MSTLRGLRAYLSPINRSNEGHKAAGGTHLPRREREKEEEAVAGVTNKLRRGLTGHLFIYPPHPKTPEVETLVVFWPEISRLDSLWLEFPLH